MIRLISRNKKYPIEIQDVVKYEVEVATDEKSVAKTYETKNTLIVVLHVPKISYKNEEIQKLLAWANSKKYDENYYRDLAIHMNMVGANERSIVFTHAEVTAEIESKTKADFVKVTLFVNQKRDKFVGVAFGIELDETYERAWDRVNNPPRLNVYVPPVMPLPANKEIESAKAQSGKRIIVKIYKDDNKTVKNTINGTLNENNTIKENDFHLNVLLRMGMYPSRQYEIDEIPYYENGDYVSRNYYKSVGSNIAFVRSGREYEFFEKGIPKDLKTIFEKTSSTTGYTMTSDITKDNVRTIEVKRNIVNIPIEIYPKFADNFLKSLKGDYKLKNIKATTSNIKGYKVGTKIYPENLQPLFEILDIQEIDSPKSYHRYMAPYTASYPNSSVKSNPFKKPYYKTYIYNKELGFIDLLPSSSTTHYSPLSIDEFCKSTLGTRRGCTLSGNTLKAPMLNLDDWENNRFSMNSGVFASSKKAPLPWGENGFYNNNYFDGNITKRQYTINGQFPKEAYDLRVKQGFADGAIVAEKFYDQLMNVFGLVYENVGAVGFGLTAAGFDLKEFITSINAAKSDFEMNLNNNTNYIIPNGSTVAKADFYIRYYLTCNVIYVKDVSGGSAIWNPCFCNYSVETHKKIDFAWKTHGKLGEENEISQIKTKSSMNFFDNKTNISTVERELAKVVFSQKNSRLAYIDPNDIYGAAGVDYYPYGRSTYWDDSASSNILNIKEEYIPEDGSIEFKINSTIPKLIFRAGSRID